MPCRERGELTGADVSLNTKHGPAVFAAGNELPRARQGRVQPGRGTEKGEAPPRVARASNVQPDPAQTYWQSVSRQLEAERNEDSLREMVRYRLAGRLGVDAKESRAGLQLPDGLTDAQRQLRGEMQALAEPALVEASRAAQVGHSYETRLGP